MLYRTALAVIASLCLFGSALAHDHWINSLKLTDPQTKQWCCNKIDCRPEAVREVEGGYATQGGDVVPFSRVLWKSQDGRWWRCRNLPANTTRCLIGPPPGS